MELKEAIDKLFEMTDEQRVEVFYFSDVEDVLNSYTMGTILELIEEFYSDPKYGDVYVDKNGNKLIILDEGYGLSEKYECPQKISFDTLSGYYTKTNKNVADRLRELFE